MTGLVVGAIALAALPALIVALMSKVIALVMELLLKRSNARLLSFAGASILPILLLCVGIGMVADANSTDEILGGPQVQALGFGLALIVCTSVIAWPLGYYLSLGGIRQARELRNDP